jgi:hypothetical protein
MGKSKMVLHGGEKDGYGQDGELSITAADCPSIFFAVPSIDDERIRATHGTEAKRELRDRLAILAYEFDAEASTEDILVMRRNPKLDKVRQP